jgi:hypothetical protein
MTPRSGAAEWTLTCRPGQRRRAAVISVPTLNTTRAVLAEGSGPVGV